MVYLFYLVQFHDTVKLNNFAYRPRIMLPKTKIIYRFIETNTLICKFGLNYKYIISV